MKATGKTVNDILINLPEERAEPFNKLHDVIVKICLKVLKRPLVMADWVMLFRIHFILMVIIVSLASPYLSRELLCKKILLIFITWVFIPIKNY